jgi:hypothetical protein
MTLGGRSSENPRICGRFRDIAGYIERRRTAAERGVRGKARAAYLAQRRTLARARSQLRVLPVSEPVPRADLKPSQVVAAT